MNDVLAASTEAAAHVVTALQLRLSQGLPIAIIKGKTILQQHKEHHPNGPNVAGINTNQFLVFIFVNYA